MTPRTRRGRTMRMHRLHSGVIGGPRETGAREARETRAREQEKEAKARKGEREDTEHCLNQRTWFWVT